MTWNINIRSVIKDDIVWFHLGLSAAGHLYNLDTEEFAKLVRLLTTLPKDVRLRFQSFYRFHQERKRFMTKIEFDDCMESMKSIR